MKKFIALALSSLMIITVLSSCNNLGGTVESNKTIDTNYKVSRENEFYKYDVYNDHIALSKYIGKESNVNIPEKIDNLPVTSISSKAFNTNTEGNTISVKKVNIPSSIQNIHSHSFYGCRDLEEVTVDEKSTAYTAIDGVLFNKEKTKIFAYPSNSSKTEYTVPDGILELQGSQFAYSKNLTSIKLPSTLTLIGDYVFHGCSALKELTIPDGVKELGSFVFLSCDSLTTITLPKSITADCSNALLGCEALKTIKGYSGTEAESIAKTLKLKFVSID